MLVKATPANGSLSCSVRASPFFVFRRRLSCQTLAPRRLHLHRKQCPYIPYTPEEIAEEGRRAVEAGASILHIHARNDDGTPAYDVETYSRIHEEVKKRTPDAIINYSTGAIHITREERIAHIVALKPDMAALNMGSMNYGIYS